MKCTSCQKDMLAERIDSKRTRYRCSSCGLSEVLDERGAPLLTEVPASKPGMLNS